MTPKVGVPLSLITYRALDALGDSSVSPSTYRNETAVLWDALLESNCGVTPYLEHDLYVRSGTNLHRWFVWATQHTDISRREQHYLPNYNYVDIYYQVTIDHEPEVATWVSQNPTLLGRCRVLSMLHTFGILPVCDMRHDETYPTPDTHN